MPQADPEGIAGGAAVTTPGGVPNLPVGALTIDNLAEKLQDMTPAAMRSRAGERMPSIFDTSTGGNPLEDLSPFGILTKLFAGFNSHVANADPNDIQGPEDLPGLLLDFIEELPVIGQLVGLVEAILGTYDGDDQALLTIQGIFEPIRLLLQLITDRGIGFPSAAELEAGWKNFQDSIGKFFNGIIPVSWIADVVEDLSQGAGEFPDVASVADNPFFAWDPGTPGWHSGGSVKVSGDGTAKSVRGEIFDVVPDQVVTLEAGVKWSSVTAAAASNPIRVGFACWDGAGNPLPDVFTGLLQPAGSSGWVDMAADAWVVPAGVARAAVLMAITGDLTAGDVWFSNVLPFKSNKLAPNIIESIIEGGQSFAEDVQNGWDAFVNGVFGGITTGRTPDDVREAAGHVTSIASDASAAANFAASMVVRPRRSPRWYSTGTHDDVSFPIYGAQSMFTPTLGDITYIPITPDTDRVYKSLKFGMVGTAMTYCYAGVYRIATDGTLTRVVDLGNVKPDLTVSKVQTFEIPGDLSVGRGETAFIAVRQVGGTAAQMFTAPSLLQVTETVQPIPTYITEKNNTGSGLPATISGAVVRTESAPAWGALGETLIDSPWADFLTPGTYTFAIPTEARYIYIAGSSAGGGGGGGDGGWNKPGEGGGRGSWSALSLERGVGIPSEITSLTVVVPAGGNGAPGREQNGSVGGSLIVRYTAAPYTVLLTITGGAYGRLAYGNFFNRDPVGQAQVNYPFFGRLFVGGEAAAMDTDGSPPGGGGGGGHGGTGGGGVGGRIGGAGFCAIRTA
ncbi:MAG: hypothetical protein ACRDUS_16280 [Mycobacterium sp.]